MRIDMATVTVSPKFQVVIPREARDSLHIRPGQKLQVMVYNGQLRFIPVRSLRELKGSYEGVGSKVERDADRL
jgi:AbrB family looped-hinge helix DNA binding protein